MMLRRRIFEYCISRRYLTPGANDPLPLSTLDRCTRSRPSLLSYSPQPSGHFPSQPSGLPSAMAVRSFVIEVMEISRSSEATTVTRLIPMFSTCPGTRKSMWSPNSIWELGCCKRNRTCGKGNYISVIPVSMLRPKVAARLDSWNRLCA